MSITRKSAAGLAVTGVVLALAAIGASPSQAAVTEDSWGRTGANCYLNPEDQENPERYKVADIGGSPAEDKVTFVRTLEKWDDASGSYVAAKPSLNITATIDAEEVTAQFNNDDAGAGACQFFTDYTDEAKPMDPKFTYGKWT